MDCLAKIYAEVPDAQCKGLCHESCGPIAMSDHEERIIIAKHGTIPSADTHSLQCNKLDNRRCSIYADRPLICRLYGATRRLKCLHGCGPAGGFMPDRAAGKLLHRADDLK